MPVALQELFVGVSFLVIQMVVNSFGVVPSAGVGVAEKVCAFVMLVPSAYMPVHVGFCGAEYGRRLPGPGEKGASVQHRDCLGSRRSNALSADVPGGCVGIRVLRGRCRGCCGAQLLKAYAIDCMLTPILFCFIGYYNGREKLCLSCCRDLWGRFWFVSPWWCC